MAMIGSKIEKSWHSNNNDNITQNAPAAKEMLDIIFAFLPGL